MGIHILKTAKKDIYDLFKLKQINLFLVGHFSVIFFVLWWLVYEIIVASQWYVSPLQSSNLTAIMRTKFIFTTLRKSKCDSYLVPRSTKIAEGLNSKESWQSSSHWSPSFFPSWHNCFPLGNNKWNERKAGRRRGIRVWGWRRPRWIWWRIESIMRGWGKDIILLFEKCFQCIYVLEPCKVSSHYHSPSHILHQLLFYVSREKGKCDFVQHLGMEDVGKDGRREYELSLHI